LHYSLNQLSKLQVLINKVHFIHLTSFVRTDSTGIQLYTPEMESKEQAE